MWESVSSFSIEFKVRGTSSIMTRGKYEVFLLYFVFRFIYAGSFLLKETPKLDLAFLVKGFQTKFPFFGAFVSGSNGSFNVLDELLTPRGECMEVLLFSYPCNLESLTDLYEHPAFDVIIFIMDSGNLVTLSLFDD